MKAEALKSRNCGTQPLPGHGSSAPNKFVLDEEPLDFDMYGAVFIEGLALAPALC